MRYFCFFSILVLSACGGSSSPTQPSSPQPPAQSTFTLSGTVSESGAARIAGASVRIGDGPNAGRSATADGSGAYTLANLQQSGFTVTVSANGFNDRSQGVDLTSSRTLDFTLQRSGPRTSFGAGQYLVGTEIASGRYFTDPSSGCYWERQSGLSGNLSDVLANEFIGFNALQWIIDIGPSDRAFETDADCGTWNQQPRGGLQTVIQPGVWLVGAQVSPGTYRAQVQSGCYWERQRDFSGTLGAIIDNEFVSSGGQQLVEIRSTDVGFHNDGDCGTWTKVSSLAPITVGTKASSAGSIEQSWQLHRQKHGNR